jgi:glycosyltransferase involved in cell wall biosynthesis
MRGAIGKLRILMLSAVHGQGHGVPVVLRLQAEYLASLGHEVIVGGPSVHRGIAYAGCHRVELHDPMEAAAYAVANDIDAVVAHTPPFFSVVRWVGDWPRCILYDYGEPPSSLFHDAEERGAELAEKRFAFGIADRVFAISSAVRAEADRDGMGVIRLGNAHLGAWSDALLPQRERTRAARGFGGKAVVLNVCRFHRAERRYKGIDLYAEVAKRFREANPALADKVLFVLAGKASKEDVAEVEALGLSAVANVSDAELTNLYAAADIYVSFSQWEGYNLGIGQALALGLQVIASDIPAHREFGITTTNDPAAAAEGLAPLVEAALSGRLLAERTPRLWAWDEPLAAFAAEVENACR